MERDLEEQPPHKFQLSQQAHFLGSEYLRRLSVLSEHVLFFMVTHRLWVKRKRNNSSQHSSINEAPLETMPLSFIYNKNTEETHRLSWQAEPTWEPHNHEYSSVYELAHPCILWIENGQLAKPSQLQKAAQAIQHIAWLNIDREKP